MRLLPDFIIILFKESRDGVVLRKNHMKAAVTTKPGGPEVIEIREKSIPSPQKGWVLIKIKAFGLNRSEIFTRQGDSPNVKYPRVQGIECDGIVDEDASGNHKRGQQVAAIMGGMGRDFDGGYAEYTLVPEKIVFPFTAGCRGQPWEPSLKCFKQYRVL